MSINNTYELLLSCLTGITSNQLAAINNEYEAFEAVYSTSVPGLNINVSNLADSFVPTTTTGLSYLDSVNSISTLASVIALPIAGVRYIASSTSTVSGVTWTINKIYTTNASLSYTEYTPVVGDAVIVSSLFKIYRWSGAAWVVEPTILTYSLAPNRLPIKGATNLTYDAGAALTITVLPTANQNIFLTNNNSGASWKLPVVGTLSTLAAIGWEINLYLTTGSTRNLDVKSSTNVFLYQVTPGDSLRFSAQANGTGISSWKVDRFGIGYTKTEADAMFVRETDTGISYTIAQSDANFLSANTHIITGLTLEQVLTIGNSTGDLNIQSPNSLSILTIANLQNDISVEVDRFEKSYIEQTKDNISMIVLSASTQNQISVDLGDITLQYSDGVINNSLVIDKNGSIFSGDLSAVTICSDYAKIDLSTQGQLFINGENTFISGTLDPLATTTSNIQLNTYIQVNADGGDDVNYHTIEIHPEYISMTNVYGNETTSIKLQDLPKTDPYVKEQLWLNQILKQDQSEYQNFLMVSLGYGFTDFTVINSSSTKLEGVLIYSEALSFTGYTNNKGIYRSGNYAQNSTTPDWNTVFAGYQESGGTFTTLSDGVINITLLEV